MTALLDAAGPRHHAVAAYASLEDTDDVTASTLPALGVAPRRVTPGPDAAELALLAHARRMQTDGWPASRSAPAITPSPSSATPTPRLSKSLSGKDNRSPPASPQPPTTYADSLDWPTATSRFGPSTSAIQGTSRSTTSHPARSNRLTCRWTVSSQASPPASVSPSVHPSTACSGPTLPVGERRGPR